MSGADFTYTDPTTMSWSMRRKAAMTITTVMAKKAKA